MFSWITKQSVRHSDGFIVESVDRFTIAYIEKGKKISIEVENVRSPSGEFCVEIKSGSFLHWDGESMLIPSTEQDRIEQNFIDAMKFQGVGVTKFQSEDE
jgi:hypothetical protein